MASLSGKVEEKVEGAVSLPPAANAAAPDPHRLAPFNPVTPDVIEALLSAEAAGHALSLALTEGRKPLFLDIGSGDGRLLKAVHEATGCDCVGIEYDEKWHNKAVASLLESAASPDGGEGGDGVSSSSASPYRLFCQDAVTFDYGSLHAVPSVIYAYLVPAGMKLMRKTLVSLLEEATNAHETLLTAGGSPAGASIEELTRKRPLLVTYLFALPDSAGAPQEGSSTASTSGATTTSGAGAVGRNRRHSLQHKVVKTSRAMTLHVYWLSADDVGV